MGIRKSYDENALVLALAAGGESCAAIARRLGLSPSYVRDIARGRAGRRLQTRIRRARGIMADETRRVAVRFLRPLLARHIRVGLEDDGETARRCREFVLKHTLSPPPPLPIVDDEQLLPPPPLRRRGRAAHGTRLAHGMEPVRVGGRVLQPVVPPDPDCNLDDLEGAWDHTYGPE
jgi:hypothetical protein